MATDLTKFDLEAAQRCGAEVAARAHAAATLELAAREACRAIYDELRGPEGERACALVRCYKTERYADLPPDIQRVAKRAYGRIAFTPPEPTLRCLTLVATVGDEPAWNDRRTSQNHGAIPLPSPHIVAQAPMIAQLIRELGFDLAQVVDPVDRVVHSPADRAWGVFHVEQALGSPYIPAQKDFVVPHRIASVVGFGGALPPDDIYAIIVFSRVRIGGAAADRFREVAVPVKDALVRSMAGGIYGS